MNNSYKKVVEKNKDFIECIHKIFLYFYKIESKNELAKNENFNQNIRYNIISELAKLNDNNYIDAIHVYSKDQTEYKISVADRFSQHWFFDLNSNNIKLTSCTRYFDSGYLYGVSEEASQINKLNDDQPETIFMLYDEDISEEINLIKLSYDLDLSFLDLTDMFFKNVESLSFIRELK